MHRDMLVAVIDTLSYLSKMGLKGFDASFKEVEKLKQWALPVPVKAETIGDVRSDLGDCQRCPLCQTRHHIVFGAGDPNARLVFVGEAPGYQEDMSGEPFVGPAGQLLTRIIDAIHESRHSVYICNVIKCRPPGNRNPLPEEIIVCAPYLYRQIAALKASFICALGNVATQTLLNTTQTISRIRGQFFKYHHMWLMPTYHPAFLLHNPSKKREVWTDMQLLMRAMKEGRPPHASA